MKYTAQKYGTKPDVTKLTRVFSWTKPIQYILEQIKMRNIVWEEAGCVLEGKFGEMPNF